MWIGRKLGHLNESPLSEPTLRKTPKPGRVTKLPSPLKPKLRASPPIERPPALICAPAEPKATISWSSAAPVSSVKSTAVIVRNEPSLIFSVSALNLKALTLPSAANSSVARTASVSGCSGRMSVGSEVVRSVIEPEIVRPGRNVTPPEATKIEPPNVDLGAGAERDAEVLDADAQVVELEDRAEGDLLRGARAARAVDQLGLAELEAVGAHDEARDRDVVGLGRRALVVGVGIDRAGDAEGRQRDLGRVDDDQRLRLAAVVGGLVVRVVADLDALAGDLEGAADGDLERVDAERERAGDVERAEDRRPGWRSRRPPWRRRSSRRRCRAGR